MDKLLIQTGRAFIRGRPTSEHPTGLFVKSKGFQGWEGITDTRREQVALAVQHGEFDAPVYLGARVVTVDGWVLARSEGELRATSQLVASVGGDGLRETYSVDHQGQVLWAQGRRLIATVEDAGVRETSGLLYASFQLQHVFADPRRYGEQRVYPATGTGTALDVFHRGAFPAIPVIEWVNPGTAYSVSSPGGVFSVTGAPSGGTHRLDMATGILTRDGVPITPTITRGELWAVPAGPPWRHTLSSAGRVRITDTYL